MTNRNIRMITKKMCTSTAEVSLTNGNKETLKTIFFTRKLFSLTAVQPEFSASTVKNHGTRPHTSHRTKGKSP
ncbi:hypothetical protein D3C84_1069200 [compost metagenome]